MTTLEKLQVWYYNQCNDDWEHGNGIKIDTIDNPGWSIKIDLIETDLENKKFKRIEVERTDYDWFHCWVKDNTFEVACGVHNLQEALEIFLNWAEQDCSS